MAKNKRRKKSASRSNPRSQSGQDQVNESATQSGEPDVATQPATSSRGSNSVDWRSEYSYVVKDLRTLSIVSGVLFAVIIGAGFFI